MAEGIQIVEQARALAGLGCPFGQGYHYARPMPYAEALRLVTGPAQLQGPHAPWSADLPASPGVLRRYGR